MSELEKVLKGKKSYIGFLTANDSALEMAQAMVAGGVDVLELGLPFTDPIADGPVIQKSSQQALMQGMNPEKYFELLNQIYEKTSVPIVVFSYYNPLLQLGNKLFTLMKNVSGVLVVDLPIEEGRKFHQNCCKHQIPPIQLISPTTSLKRQQMLLAEAKGFVYYVCRKGTTGVQPSLPANLEEKIQEIRSITDVPIGVGFGVSKKEQASQILEHADAFIVGSYFVRAIQEGKTAIEIEKIVKSLDPR